MSKKEIRNITVEEIKTKIGKMIYPDQIRFILTEEAYKEEVLEQMEQKAIDFTAVYDFVEENFDRINKERLIFLTAMNLKEVVDRLTGRHIQNFAERMSFEQAKEQLEYAKKVLSDSDVEIPVIAKRGNRTIIEKVLTIDDLIPNKKRAKSKSLLKDKNQQIITDLKKEGLIDPIFDFSSLEDFEHFLCNYSGNGKFFTFVVKKNGDRKFLSTVTQDLSEREKYKVLSECYKAEFLKILEEHSDRFDVERFLLISAYRAKDILENYEGITLEEKREHIRIMEYVSQHIENPKRKISADAYVETMSDRTHIEYSYKHLQKDLSRVIDGLDGKYYFSERYLKEAKKSILDGTIAFQEMNFVGLFELLNFDFNEKKKLVELNPANFEYLLALNGLEEKEIHQMIENGLGDFKVKHICLYDNHLLEKSEIIKMYMKHYIDLSQMTDFAEMYPSLENEISLSNLMRYYENMQQNPEKTADFERYSLIFRNFRLNGKSPHMQEEMITEIAMQLCEKDSEYDDFKNLYKFHLLPIQTLMEWNGEEIIYDLIKNASLKPRDAKSLLLEGKLNLEKTCYTLKNSILSDEEKLNFIFSSFNGAGNNEEQIKVQDDARKYLMQALSVSNEIIHNHKTNSLTKSRAQVGIPRKIRRKSLYK